jgi:transcriptional regulator with XRE-family HTH domain
MSQRALAGRSGVDQPTISRLERGVLPGISLRRLAAIVAALPDLFR